MISFNNVSLRYGLGPVVLQGLSFDLEKGSFHFLTGESGAGKSSLLSLLYLAQKPTRGNLSIFGTNVATSSRQNLLKLRQKIGVVFQEFYLLDHLSTFENVALPLRVMGKREKDIKTQVSELLEWVGLQEHMHALPPTLSGGQKQRVAIARAVINNPDLILADEPTGSVDDHMAKKLLHLFTQLNKAGTTIVVATHNEHMIQQMAYPRLHLKEGKAAIRRCGA